MAGATYVLDKTYKCTEANGVGRFLAVSPGTNDGEAKRPGSASAYSYGINQEDATLNKQMRVRKLGISRCIFGDTIVPGDPLEVATTGKLTKCALANAKHVVGYAESSGDDGDQGFVFLAPFNTPAS